jgi:hypothetical protein
MKLFVTATPAPEARTPSTRAISFIYAAIIVVMLVAQLFSFEEFIQHLITLDLPGGRPTAHFVAAFTVAMELFALPFLLRMKTSPAFRYVSLAAGWIVAFIWIYISSWILLTVPEASTIGFLGTVVDTTPGGWGVLLSILFGIMAVWTTWGMGPQKPQQRKKREILS